MAKGIFIIGTDTEVGKTLVSGGLMHLLMRNQKNAVYFKPVASGEVFINNVSSTIDANFVKAVSGLNEDDSLITPFFFKNAVAPHLAARLENKPIDVAVIEEKFKYLKKRYEIILAEGAGGLAIPLNNKGFLQSELIRMLNFPCLLVARTTLGTINHTLLTLSFAKAAGLKIKGIILNNNKNTLIEEDNIKTLQRLSGLDDIFVVPSIDGVSTETLSIGNTSKVFEQTIDIEKIIALMETL